MSKEAETLPGILRGNLNYMILRVLKKGPSHGYAIIKSVEAITGDMWKPTTGSVYPALAQMGEDRLIAVKETEAKGRKRKVYGITKKGLRELEKKKECVVEMVKAASEMFQHLFPKEIPKPDELLGLIEESKPMQREIAETKMNTLRVLRLSREGKVSAKEKGKIKRKLQELNALLLDTIAGKEK